jgi:hypothetical protein
MPANAAIELGSSGELKGALVVMNEVFSATVEQLSALLLEQDDFLRRMHQRRHNKGGQERPGARS